MTISTHTTKRPRRNRRLKSIKFRREINQERLLLGVAELLQFEMEAQDKSVDKMQQELQVNQAYIQSVLHGFANITLRELADIFSVLSKRIVVDTVSVGESKNTTVVVEKNLDNQRFRKVKVIGTTFDDEKLVVNYRTPARLKFSGKSIEAVAPERGSDLSSREFLILDLDEQGQEIELGKLIKIDNSFHVMSR